MCKISGKVLVLGDLHFSAVYKGQHKDYKGLCIKNMERILSLVKEGNIDSVVFLGDIVGVNETAIRDHSFLLEVIKFFEELNKLCFDRVYSVKGNHDFSEFSDFDLLLGLGLIKNVSYVDYVSINNKLLGRFHLVNYGDEGRPLSIEGNVPNIVFGHADYQIDGVTNWYKLTNKQVNLASLDNFKDVSLIVSGHIHLPSDSMLSCKIGGNVVNLCYLGSMSRVVDRLSTCWYMVFSELEGVLDYDILPLNLEPVSEVFYSEASYENTSDVEDIRELQSQALTDIVKDVIAGRLTKGDLFSQIDVIPTASDNVKAIAKNYLKMAIDKV